MEKFHTGIKEKKIMLFSLESDAYCRDSQNIAISCTEDGDSLCGTIRKIPWADPDHLFNHHSGHLPLSIGAAIATEFPEGRKVISSPLKFQDGENSGSDILMWVAAILTACHMKKLRKISILVPAILDLKEFAVHAHLAMLGHYSDYPGEIHFVFASQSMRDKCSHHFANMPTYLKEKEFDRESEEANLANEG